MQQITKLYENTTPEDINVNGVGLITAGERLSVTSEYPTPVQLANYPGICEVGGLGAEDHAIAVKAANQAYSDWKVAHPDMPTPGVTIQADASNKAGSVGTGGLDIQSSTGETKSA